jgi:hypothetical protein
MTDYRLYTVGNDGHFAACRVFACENDDDAIVWAKQWIDGTAVELWNLARLVIRLEPKPGSDPY